MARNGRTDFGTSNGMTDLDVRKLRRRYDCDSSAPSDCGGDVRTFPGFINATAADRPSGVCRWNFTAPEGTRVLFEFHLLEVLMQLFQPSLLIN